MYMYILASFPGLRGGEGKAWYARTVCACALISRHSGNSVLRTDNSVFKLLHTVRIITRQFTGARA